VKTGRGEGKAPVFEAINREQLVFVVNDDIHLTYFPQGVKWLCYCIVRTIELRLDSSIVSKRF